jgi:hypothetical protein
MFTRMIAMGFYNKTYDPKANMYRTIRDKELERINPAYVQKYLNDAWNKLDFVVVISSWVNVLVEATGMELGIEVSTLRALRILRVLRSLRFFAGIKTILSVIAQAIPYAANVLAFISFLFIVTGIIGVQMFRGRTRSRCVYGAFNLQAELNLDKFPLVPVPIDCSFTAGDPSTCGAGCRYVAALDVIHEVLEGCAITDSSSHGTDATLCNYTAGDVTTCDTGSCTYTATVYGAAPIVEDCVLTGEDLDGGHFSTLLNNSYPSPKPAIRPEPTYEYPIGIGVWTKYCTQDGDCLLYDVPGMFNRTQRCVPFGVIDDGGRNPDDVMSDFYVNAVFYKDGDRMSGTQKSGDRQVLNAHPGRFGNPGKGFQHFDTIFDAWIALFINMANLYWWETAHRIMDSNDGLGSNIAWGYGLLNVCMLTYISLNMFVAVITTVFADVRSAENPTGGMTAEKPDKADRDYENKVYPKWNKPFYYVGGLGGPGGPYEARRREKMWERFVIGIETKQFELDVHFKKAVKKIMGQPAMGINKEVPPMAKDTLVSELKRRDLEPDGDEGLLMDRLLHGLRLKKQDDDQKVQDEKANYDMGPHGFINGSLFNNVIMFFSLFNTVILALEHHGNCCVVPDGNECSEPGSGIGQEASCESTDHECIRKHISPEEMCQSDTFIFYNTILNYLFNFVFAVELLLKVFGMGFKAYIKVIFNQLDFFIVVTSSLDMLSEAMKKEGEEGGGMAIFKLFRVFRLFRVLRVARFLYKNENLKRVLQTVFGSGEALGNLFLFIVFAIMLFAILGMHLMGGNFTPDNPRMPGFGDNSGSLYGRLVGDVKFLHRHEGAHNTTGYDVPELIRIGAIPRRNFEDFPRAFLMAFQIMTGDDWVNQMNDYQEVYGQWMPAFIFFSNFSFCNFILLSLFIAVILENFAVAEANKMELQKHQHKTKQEKMEEDARRPKVTFVHRLLFMVKAQGSQGFMNFDPELVNIDTKDGKFLPPEFDDPDKKIESRFSERTGLVNKWYNDDTALFIFKYDNGFRKACAKLAENAIFDLVILTAIMIGTVMLAYEGPPGVLDRESPELRTPFDITSHILFGIFVVEFMTKIVAYGFMFPPDAYIKSPWNKLDFVVISGTILGYMGFDTSIVKLFRCLRPLRIINRNEGMRVIISAVTQSLAVNIGVLALAGMGGLIFGILGVNMFGGKYYSCNCNYVYPPGVTPETHVFGYMGEYTNMTSGITTGCTTHECEDKAPKWVDNQIDCSGPDLQGGIYGIDPNFANSVSECYWDNRPYNFDTCMNAMQALFTASTLAGWTDIMEIGLDSGEIGEQPLAFRKFYMVGYFLMYVLIMAFFVTNLFIGVLIDFIGHSDGSALLTEEQQKLIDMQKFQKLHRPSERETAPGNCIRRWFYGLVESSFWDKVSNGVIVFNVIIMMCEYQDQTPDWEALLELLNDVCLWFFTFEMAFKLIGYFPVKYWKDPWSKFDAIVIALSWTAKFVDFGSVQAIRAMRAFRIVLVLKSAKGIRSLFQTLILSVAPAVNITVLLLLLYSLYGILGMQLFGSAPLQDTECAAPPNVFPIDTLPFTDPDDNDGKGMNNYELSTWCNTGICGAGEECPGSFGPAAFGQMSKGTPGHMMMGVNRQYTHHSNFKSFGRALMLLFQCAAGQDWKFVMYAVGGEPGLPEGLQGSAFLYFFSFFFLSNYILLNLFIAVILDNFAASMREQALDISEIDFETFKYMFREKTTDSSPESIAYGKLWLLLKESGDTDGHDDDGNVIENPFSPGLFAVWTKENETAWKLAKPRDDTQLAFKDVFGVFQALYEEGNNPIEEEDQPGETFEEYWLAMLLVPGVFKSAPLCWEGERNPDENGMCWMEEDLRPFPSNNDGGQLWDDYCKFALMVLGDERRAAEGKDEPVAASVDDGARMIDVETVKEAVQTLRFRANYHNCIRELEFHGLEYMNESSTLDYDQVLRAFVQNRMGKESLTLEEQMARSPELFKEESDSDDEEPPADPEGSLD